MKRTILSIALLFTGSLAFISCNNPEREQNEERRDPMMDETPLPPESMEPDTTQLDTMPPAETPRANPVNR